MTGSGGEGCSLGPRAEVLAELRAGATRRFPPPDGNAHMEKRPPPRYLTKSRFQLAVSCPTKLYYTGKPDLYPNTKDEDDFLRALADGGIQVGELAKLMFPGGIEITSRTHAEQVEDTRRLLAQDEITIFEAAIQLGELFIRIDVLRKTGNRLELFEVKAKSIDMSDGNPMVGKRGGTLADWLSYLQDAAFQRHVLTQAYPGLQVAAFLMLVDKTARCSVDGLHQRFRVRRRNGRSVAETRAGTGPDDIGEPILTRVPVDDYLDMIMNAPLEAPGAMGDLPLLAEQWATAYREDRRIEPVIGAHCGGCEFRAEPGLDGVRSGFHECWQERTGLSVEELAAGTVLDLWNFRGKGDLLEAGILRLSDVTREHLNLKASDGGLNRSQRQWMQASGEWPGGGDFFIDKALMRREMATWTFPLHFIDFEATRVAIPFYAGERPYSSIAFQFSVHVVEQDGSVRHHDEFLSTEPGRKPNYEFVRRLRGAIGPVGTVFMWTHYENTILNGIRSELQNDPAPPEDASALLAFIESLTRHKAERVGERAMVDLCKLAEQAFFHPDTRGSSSIKKVLPAVLQASGYLRERYSQPVYGADGGTPSRNFTGQVWWQDAGGGVPADPYQLLPPVFSDIPREVIEALELDEDSPLAEGGAAMVAFGRLQYEDVAPEERASIEAALKRYCELDTLAMVMIYEAWREWVGEQSEARSEK